MNDKRNVIESVTHQHYTKKELYKLIEKYFPNDEVGTYGQIVEITTTKMTDGSKMQSALFGKIME